MYTMSNADTGNSGSGTQTVKIDLTNYALKSETTTTEAFTKLVDVVANKLDKEPIHHHKISDIDELQTELNAKYDKNSKYSYNVILSDSEKIPLLENTKIINLDITSNKNTSGYVFNLNSNGDLQITKNNNPIMVYSVAGNSWFLNGVDILDTLENHMEGINTLRDAIQELAGMIDELANQINSKLWTKKIFIYLFLSN